METLTVPQTAAASLLRDLEPVLTEDHYPQLLAQWRDLLLALRSRLPTGGRPVANAAQIHRAHGLARWIYDRVIYPLPDLINVLHWITDDPDPIWAPLFLYLDEDRRIPPDGPPTNETFTGTDIGTGATATLEMADPALAWALWWPRVPDQLAPFRDWSTCPVDLLELAVVDGWSRTLFRYAYTQRDLLARAAGYDQGAALVPTNVDGGNLRGDVRKIGRRYAATAERFAPLGDRIVSEFRTEIETAWAELAALLIDTPITGKDITMPTLLGTPAAISSLAQQIRAALDSGHGGRLQVSATAEQAFAWAGTPRTLLSYLGTGQADTRRFTVAIAKDSATAVGPIAEGALKPNLVDFTSEDLDMLKFAGSATMSVESAQFVANIEQATTTVMVGRILRAIEADAAAEIITDAGVEITGAADITAGTIAAIAAIASNGGTANVVGLSSADWVAIMTASGTSGFINFNDPEAGPGGTWLGLVPVLIPGLPANTSIVLDGHGATVTEIGGGPLCIVDPFTEAKNNKISIYLETWAKTAVTSPGLVASVVTTATP